MVDFYDAIESTRLTEDSHTPVGRDHARAGMPLPTLERFLEDLRWEGAWRTEADRAAEYYDSNQLDPDTVEALEEKGLGPLIRNIVKPTVDAVLGMEERTRTDWKLVSDYDDEQDVADALSVKVAEAERETNADRAISDAYAGQIKSGFAAVEVARSSNPFLYQYRVKHIHRREIYWDPRSRENDWSDARFILRKRWFDVDVAAAYFPQHARLLKHTVEGWAGWEELARLSDYDTTELVRAHDIERSSSIEQMEWLDTTRGRVCIYELWYRTFHRGFVLKLPRGRTIEFNRANPQHLALASSGLIDPIEAVYDKIRCAYFVGPHRLADFGTKRRRYPYIPFWGYREDKTGIPYGLIRSMTSVQDEINARLAKMMWLLSSRRTVIDEDAPATKYNTHAELSREVARADAYIVLNKDRRNANAFSVDENLQLAEAQHRAMVDAVNAMPAVSGVFAPLLGQNTTTTAASAISQLIDQGTTTLAEINGNYTMARRMVGEELVTLIREDLAGREQEVTVDTGVTKRHVFINRKAVDPKTGVDILENNVEAAQIKVQLADTPSHESYRQQQFAQLSEIAKSLPPDVQAFIVPFIIEASDMPKRREIAKLLREKLGILTDEESPEGQAAKQQAEQQAALEAQQIAEKFDAELGEQKAKTAKLEAETEKIRVEIAQSQLEARERAAAEGQLDGIRREYDEKLGQAQRDLASSQLDAEAKRLEAQARAEGEEARAREETERERIRAASAEEVARINALAKSTEDALKQQIAQLSSEMDERLADLLRTVREGKKKDEPKDGA